MIDISFLVPMKGHSERVKNKNLRLFAGKPLYHAIMNSLIASKFYKKIFVNTDSEKIAEDIHKSFKGKIEIIDRPSNICGDNVSMNSILKHDLSVVNGDLYLQTHSTNPLLSTQTIDSAIEYFVKKMRIYDSLFSVTELRTRLYNKDMEPLNHNPKQLLRTQDLDPVYEENSNFYIFSRESFNNNKFNRIGKNPTSYKVSKIESIDIDEPEDFVMAECLYLRSKDEG